MPTFAPLAQRPQAAATPSTHTASSSPVQLRGMGMAAQTQLLSPRTPVQRKPGGMPGEVDDGRHDGRGGATPDPTPTTDASATTAAESSNATAAPAHGAHHHRHHRRVHREGAAPLGAGKTTSLGEECQRVARMLYSAAESLERAQDDRFLWRVSVALGAYDDVLQRCTAEGDPGQAGICEGGFSALGGALHRLRNTLPVPERGTYSSAANSFFRVTAHQSGLANSIAYVEYFGHTGRRMQTG